MSEKKPYWNPYLGGLLLGIVLFLAFALTGHGLGASGAVARGTVAVEKAVDPARVDGNPLTAEWGGGTRNPLDHWLVWMSAGVLLGGFVSGWFAGRVKLETFKGPRVSTPVRLVAALIGGALMGYGARLARGCTSGQALSGGATLSLGSWALMFAIFAGAFLLAWPLRRLWT